MNPFRYGRESDALGVIALCPRCPRARSSPALPISSTTSSSRNGNQTCWWTSPVSPSDHIEPLPDGGVRIGAQVRNTDLAADRNIRARYPVLAQALLAGASSSYGTSTQSGAICSSAPAASTSRMPLCRATSGSQGRAARRGRATTASWRSSAPRPRASRRIRPILP